MRLRPSDRLQRILAEKEKVLVSYSGGVDSTVLAAAAREVLGQKSSCVILDSPLLPRRSLKKALDRAEKRSGSMLRLSPFLSSVTPGLWRTRRSAATSARSLPAGS